MVVLGENQSYGKPTLNYCKSYAQQYNVPIDKIYIDWGDQYNSFETLFSHLNPYLQPDGSFALPWDAVLDGDNMEYIHCSMAGPYPSAEQAKNDLLND
jgi:hypothetical protein